MITQTSYHPARDEPVRVESAQLATGDVVFTVSLGSSSISFHMTPRQAMVMAHALTDHAERAMVGSLIAKQRQLGQIPLPHGGTNG